MGILDKFKLGLSKSSKSLSSGLNDLIFKRKIDENMLDELEDFLIQSDVGVESAKELREKFANIKINPKSSEKDKIFKIFSNYAAEILKPLEKNLENLNENKPSVILIAGVNGVGKTTTIGKLGKILGQNNKKIVFGAADTFRAAAVNQLEIWAKRINADIIKSEEGADPASVAYKALEHAKNNNFDYLLIDTAGRLQNKKNLMDEFKKITPITGIIMTKLDGTAKGGILLAIGKKFKLPIVALGMGEKEDDLQKFNSEYFSNALMHS